MCLYSPSPTEGTKSSRDKGVGQKVNAGHESCSSNIHSFPLEAALWRISPRSSWSFLRLRSWLESRVLVENKFPWQIFLASCQRGETGRKTKL
ncbi:hypothetical protein Fmac_023988 [Flemingia macrophylla]|uniref:Uncharacterized protein n=1 Tax=Flemingia macrophylla TaxID=520843 RepID=A0ABD1LN40_9FABA